MTRAEIVRRLTVVCAALDDAAAPLEALATVALAVEQMIDAAVAEERLGCQNAVLAHQAFCAEQRNVAEGPFEHEASRWQARIAACETIAHAIAARSAPPAGAADVTEAT